MYDRTKLRQASFIRRNSGTRNRNLRRRFLHIITCYPNLHASNTSNTSKMSLSNLDLDPEKADNYEEMEKQFAVKAVHQMTVYWSILEKLPGSKLRLTRMDDEILGHLKKEFPDFDPAAELKEDEMKSKDGKEKWRNFCMVYEMGDKKVEDYNFGTMLRKSSKTEYGEKETIFAVRMQFYAIEIARNRAGLNDWIYEKAQNANNGASTTV